MLTENEKDGVYALGILMNQRRLLSSSDYFNGLIFYRVSPITGTLANGPPPSLLASSLPVSSSDPAARWSESIV